MNKIEIGSSIPTFTLTDQNGSLFYINFVPGKKNLVIYMFDSKMQATRHVDEALKICMLLKRTDHANN